MLFGTPGHEPTPLFGRGAGLPGTPGTSQGQLLLLFGRAAGLLGTLGHELGPLLLLFGRAPGLGRNLSGRLLLLFGTPRHEPVPISIAIWLCSGLVPEFERLIDVAVQHCRA